MAKLQLYITKLSNDYRGDILKINPSEDISRHVTELRNVVEKIKYDSAEKNIFYYVRTISTGTFVTIIRTIPPHPVDHLATWIYIPNEMVIDGEALEQVVNATARKISGEKVTAEDVTSLRELFAREYMTDSNVAAMTACKTSGEVAWRRYGGDSEMSLRDLLGAGLFQLSYIEYNGLLLIDGDLGITVDGADLTAMPILGPAVIVPAPRSPEQFVAHIFGRPVDTNIRANRDANVAFVWKHAGFEDVVKEEVITSGEFQPTPPDTSASRKAITKSTFQITPQTSNTPLTECNITVNGIEITDEPTMFTTADLVAAVVTINCEGYKPYSQKIDLATATRAMIRLPERTKIYCFEMPVKSADLGAPVRFKLFTKKFVTESPIEGYSVKDSILEGESRTNHLAYTGGKDTLIARGIYVAIGLVVGLLIGMLCKCGGDNKTVPAQSDATPEVVDETNIDIEENGEEGEITDEGQDNTNKTTTNDNNATQPKQTTQAENKPVNSESASKDAISYLDNNKTWTKEGLEKHPSLKGLFDDMNNFRLEKLRNEWAKKLGNSKGFKRIVDHLGGAIVKNKKGKTKLDGTTFTNGSEITVQSYLVKIDP